MTEQILSLPLEQKIGQLFFIGIAGASIDETAAKLLDEITPGGVCLFARNIREPRATRELLDGIRERSAVRPFLSVDQEGGLVDRLRRLIEPMPAAEKLKSPSAAAALARITAEVLSMLGFNMNFAPVVDVIDDSRRRPDNGLFSRAFGNNAADVVAFASAYLDAQQSGGIAGCLKHFPGLGAASVDSHEELPEVTIEPGELEECDLRPYRELLARFRSTPVMVAHAAYPKHGLQEKDRNGRLLPSSLSFNFITKLLRDELGFDGLVLTDDLEMGAIVRNYGIGEACKMALLAGNDQLLICNAADAIREGYAAVLQAARTGEISSERIDASLRRIAAAKGSIISPTEFDEQKLNALSGEVVKLKAQNI